MAGSRKISVKKKSSKTGAARARRSTRGRSTIASNGINRFALPAVISLLLAAGIVFFAAMGYRTAAASDFFAVKRIDVSGTDRSSVDDIKRIVTSSTEKTGVWLADMPAIREKLERLPFVKAAAVSMALPGGIRVVVTERVPMAIVRITGGDFLVDGDGVILTQASKPEPSLPFVLRGWDESKSEKAPADNLQRLKLYKRMLDEWKDAGIADRVKEVNLADLREPTAIVEDSGHSVMITVARDSLAKSLRSAIEAIAGKGDRIKAVNAGGLYPVLEYMGN